MTRILLIILLFFSFNNLIAQNFIPGYIINSNDEKINCFIYLSDSKKNPSDFLYKLSNSPSEESKRGSTSEIKEFGIANEAKFERHLVDMDMESSGKNSTSRNPKFKKQTVFLKVLVEGDATLYSYDDLKNITYFYSLKNGLNQNPPLPLIYRKYSSNGFLLENQNYKQEIINSFDSKAIAVASIENLNYKEQSLRNFFVEYNTSINADFFEYESKKKGELNLKIAPRVVFTSFSVDQTADFFSGNNLSTDFSDKTSFSLGIELEYIFPFNNLRWSVFMEPTYNNYENSTIFEPRNSDVNINYKSVEIPIGARHYFPVSDKSSIFINAGINIDLLIGDNQLRYEDYGNNIFDLKSNLNFLIGIGYNFNKKFDFEFRYNTNRDLIGNRNNIGADFQSSSFIFRYNVL